MALQGFYSAASGMLMQQRVLNVVANNLGNTQTTGFKANRLISSTFEQTMLTRLERYNVGGIGTGEPARIVEEVADLWTAGGVTETGRPFDLAITGYGFFNVQGEDGQVYLTRYGQLDLDDEGYLEVRGKGRVMGTGGPMQLGTSNINVDEQGNITNTITGQNYGQLLITMPAQDAEIEEQFNGMYTTDAVVAAPDPVIVQGGYENSNVDLTTELTAMMVAQRNFNSASQALQIIDRTYNDAVKIASL